MRRWSFKPALLRSAQEWRIEGADLHGPEGRIDLGTVDRAAFVDQSVKGYRFTRLDLMAGDRTIPIPVTSPPASKSGEGTDPDRVEFFALTLAVAQILADRQPELPVSLGEYGRSALIMFLVGVLSLLFGLGLGIAALASGISGERLGATAVPVLLMVALGGTLTWARRPWKPAPEIPAKSLPVLLEAYSGAQSNAVASTIGE